MDPIDRVLGDLGEARLSERLAELPGADLTTLLLDVMRRRTKELTAADVVRQYERDRFVAPGTVDFRELHATEGVLLEAVPESFESVTLSPVAPLGLHSAVARVDQNNLLATVRRSDVAGDPTAGLALEAAIRRRGALAAAPKSAHRVDLVSLQRVTRAQRFEGPLSFAHFSLLGLVSAGRDQGNHFFESTALAAHATILCEALLATGADEIVLTLSDWTDGVFADLESASATAIADDRLVIAHDPDRDRARGYYELGAFEIGAAFGDTRFSAGDGGLVDWTRHLVGSRKERLMISGLGVDRIAIARSARKP